MYRLIDDIARERLLYPAPIPGAPAVLLIDVPRPARGPGLALGRYYAILPETDGELDELEVFLTAPRTAPVRPDLLDRRPSQVRSDDIAVIRFDPSRAGWPWLSVCRWPAAIAGQRPVPAGEMARGCYTFEAFADPAALEDHQTALLVALRRNRLITVRLIAGASTSSPGHA